MRLTSFFFDSPNILYTFVNYREKNMKLKIVFIVILSLLVNSSYTQINIQWEARLNGVGNFIDKAVYLVLDADGNTYVTGTSYNGTSYDIMTVKYDSDGVELWRTSYGGVGIDEGHAIALNTLGNVFVTGSRFIGGTDWDIVTIKYSAATGAIIWSIIHPGSGQFDTGVDVVVDNANQIIVAASLTAAGAGNTDFLTIKYNNVGTLVWSNIAGGTRSDIPKVLMVDASNNVYVGGHHEYTVGSTYFDFKLIKYNSSGVIQWSVTEDSGFGKLDTPHAMALDASNNIILAGSGFTDILNEEDYLTMKFNNSTGALMWKSIYAGNAEALDVVNAVAVDDLSNVYVTGKSKSIATSEDFYTIAYNSLGTEIWSHRYSTVGLKYDEAKDIQISDDFASVYVTGYSFYAATNNDFATVKYNAADGNVEWTTIFNGPSSNSDQALKMQLDPTENIFITGNSHGGATNLDFSTIKYCQLTTSASPDTSVCIGGSVDLVATGGDDVTWEVLSGDAGSMSCSLCETMTATPTESTVYIVSSTSLSGCVDYDTVSVVVNDLPTVSIYNDTPLDFCLGDSVVLYTDTYDAYDWSTGGDEVATTVFTGGTVTLTVEDTNACSNTAEVEIIVYDIPFVDAGVDVSICPGTSVELDASGAVSYLWNAHPTLVGLLLPNPTASPVAATAYVVTGTDGDGCQNRDTVVVSLFTLPAVSAGPDETICLGDSVNLLATGATSYLWTFSPSLSELDIADPWASPTILTEYFVTGTDDNGCTNIDSINVSILALPAINAGIDTVVCIGGTIQLFATGGLPGMYVWEDDPTLSSLVVYNPFATPGSPTYYYVTGTDINGCSNSDSVFVDTYDLPAVFAGLDENLCIGDSVHLNATGALSYLWGSDPSLSALDVADPWANPLTTKTYTVTGVDVNGCENEDEITVNVIPLPGISAGLDVAICFGDSTQLDASGGVLYVWDFEPTLSNFLIGDPWASPLVTKTYIVEGTDAFGCSNTDEVTVTVNPLPAVPVLSVDSVFIISSVEIGNQWVLDGDLLAGETNDSINYVEIGLNGEYWVILTNEFGCSVESNRIENPIFITDVSVPEFDGLRDVMIYPNPTLGLINIVCDENLDQITVLSLDGKVIYQENNLQAGTSILDLYSLPSGTYLIQFVRGDQVMVKKAVKQ